MKNTTGSRNKVEGRFIGRCHIRDGDGWTIKYRQGHGIVREMPPLSQRKKWNRLFNKAMGTNLPIRPRRKKKR